MRLGPWLFRNLKTLAVVYFLIAASVFAQSSSCVPTAPHAAAPAEVAYGQGKFDTAESLYMQAVLQDPHNIALSAALVRTLLRQDKVADAATLANKTLADNPNSAAALTSSAEVEYRKGAPWLAMETLDVAVKADPCDARAHLIRSRILRIDSMYASERRELQTAYDLDPEDPDIKHAWLHIDSPAYDIKSTENALATMNNVDADLREKAMASVHALMGQLTENSQTCKSSPIADTVALPLMPVFQDMKHITGYQLEVQFAEGKTKLQVDTAASGLYISRALADANGFQRAAGDPANTVRVTSVHIGPLEFRDCMMGISDTPFPDKGSGFIGTDVFAPYLITLNYPEAKLELAPLPAIPTEQGTDLPGDRYTGAGLREYSPVYHRLQYLLVPVMLNKKERKLFLLDSGIRLSAMTLEVAHSISATKVNFTNPVQTVFGRNTAAISRQFRLSVCQSITRQPGAYSGVRPIGHRAKCWF